MYRYMDCNSTTSLNEKVIATMLEFASSPLNASSAHKFGKNARNLLEESRIKIAKFLNINLKTHDIIFLSSGTEANNMIMRSYRHADVFISGTEHVSIYAFLGNKNVSVIEVDSCGIVNLEHLENSLINCRAAKKIVSVIYANNETGVINPIQDIAKIAQKHQALMHSDCVQVIGKYAFNFDELGLDFATISSHKIGGPHGIAALIARKGHITPMIIGGGQERGSRSGTENVLGAIGFAKAIEIAVGNVQEYTNYTSQLRDILESKLANKCEIIGKFANRLPNTSMILMPSVDAQTQLMHFDMLGFAVSNGAACSSGTVKQSHVLRAIKCKEDLLNNGIRVSLDLQNTHEDIEDFFQAWMDMYINNN